MKHDPDAINPKAYTLHSTDYLSVLKEFGFHKDAHTCFTASFPTDVKADKNGWRPEIASVQIIVHDLSWVYHLQVYLLDHPKPDEALTGIRLYKMTAFWSANSIHQDLCRLKNVLRSHYSTAKDWVAH
jgi:hypothetical protein